MRVAAILPTAYARSGEVHIAYQVIGSGPRDVLLVPGIYSHVELMWEDPSFREFLERLASFTRLIVFDMRGIGLSDRAPWLPTLEDQIDDVIAVLDAVGAERPAMIGLSQAGPMAMLFAALHPERLSSLVLYGTYATAIGDDDYPWGRSEEWVDWYCDQAERLWGSGVFLESIAPSSAADPLFRAWWGRLERNASAPGNVQAYMRAHAADDVRNVLQTISVPTLVLQRADDRFRDPRNGRYLAERIPGARYVELPGSDHLAFLGDRAAVLDEVEAFLTGVRPRPHVDRLLTTVMFSDLVGSTEMAGRLGDRAWGELLERHHAIVRELLELHRGVEVDTAGDGFFAIFDGPARAVRCALALGDALKPLGLEVRCGVHTGEVERSAGAVRGIAVHIGARIAGMATAGEVIASRTVRDLVGGSGLQFEDRGTHRLTGIDEPWQLFAAAGESVGGR